MSEAGRVCRLVRGGELLAELVVTGGDFPWLSATVRPAVAFAGVRPLFGEGLRRLEFLDDELEQREAAYRRIREVVRLLAPDGRPVPEFLLHIEGEDAWWRRSDEPFPEGNAGPGNLARSCRRQRRRCAAAGVGAIPGPGSHLAKAGTGAFRGAWAPAVARLMTRSAAITGHRPERWSWSGRQDQHAQLAGLGPRARSGLGES